MPHLTQFLIFELGQHCNLWNVHKDCPTSLGTQRYSRLDTSRQLDDEAICSVARRMYGEHGFRGMVGWHYYNEPTLEADRMFRLMERIKLETPSARFVLWTNGTLIGRDVSQYAAFSIINVTDYTREGHPPIQLGELRMVCPAVQVWGCHHDNRLMALAGPSSLSPCVRPFTELIVDAFGNTHLCCYDWKGETTVGNVLQDSLAFIMARWRAVRDGLAGKMMSADAPPACRTCTMRCGRNSNFVLEVAEDANRYVEELRARVMLQEHTSGHPAVVFVHYNPPGGNLSYERLQEHFRWNDAAYRRVGARVYVVADQAYHLPEYAVALKFPWSSFPVVDGKQVFSLSKTKNFGIQCASAAGCDPIVVADTDIHFPGDSLGDLASVPQGQAVVPIYVMKTWPDRDDPQDHHDRGCTGTLSMRMEHWRSIRFDERYVGYGGEDGQLIQDIEAAGIGIVREGVVWHQAHQPGVNPRRTGGVGAECCWNRDGFNPDMFALNVRVAKGL